jgi:hypothetical protein
MIPVWEARPTQFGMDKDEQAEDWQLQHHVIYTLGRHR